MRKMENSTTDTPLHNSMKTVVVRGMRFEIPLEFLNQHEESQLARLLLRDGDNETNETPTMYLNRDPYIFSQILDYLQHGEIHLTGVTCASILERELEYWGLSDNAVAPCCRARYIDERLEIQERKKHFADTNGSADCSERISSEVGSSSDGTKGSTWRHKCWKELEELTSKKAKVYRWVMLFANLLSVLGVVLSTVPSCRQEENFVTRLIRDTGYRQPNDFADDGGARPNSSNSSEDHVQSGKLLGYLYKTTPHVSLTMIELVTSLILTVDVLLRFACCPSKMAFVVNPFTIISIISLIIIWLGLALYVLIVARVLTGLGVSKTLDVLEALRFLRAFYIFEVFKKYRPMKVIALSIRHSLGELTLLVLLISVATLIYGSLFYLAELPHDTVWSIPEGVWLATITMTTVGYGDVYPVGTLGKVVGILCAVTGILVIALPIPIIANNFMKYYRVYQLSDRMRQFDGKTTARKLSSQDIQAVHGDIKS